MALAQTFYNPGMTESRIDAAPTGAGGGYSTMDLIDRIAAARRGGVSGHARPRYKDEGNAERTNARLRGMGGTSGSARPGETAAERQLRNAQVRSQLLRIQAADQGPPVEHRYSGGVYLGLQPKTEVMNAHQREFYLPSGAGFIGSEDDAARGAQRLEQNAASDREFARSRVMLTQPNLYNEMVGQARRQAVAGY